VIRWVAASAATSGPVSDFANRSATSTPMAIVTRPAITNQRPGPAAILTLSVASSARSGKRPRAGSGTAAMAVFPSRRDTDRPVASRDTSSAVSGDGAEPSGTTRSVSTSRVGAIRVVSGFARAGVTSASTAASPSTRRTSSSSFCRRASTAERASVPNPTITTAAATAPAIVMTRRRRIRQPRR
jgi:hypothetical protein